MALFSTSQSAQRKLWCSAVLGYFIALASSYPHFHGQIRDAGGLLSHYDYVIVGGGASGLTVANRLSEDAEITVLVIEAGLLDQGEDSLVVPGLAGSAVGTKYDWNLTYVPNPDVGNRSVSIPLGKIVGGGTKLNRMVFDRGTVSDYDAWKALGNPGWGWDSLFHYMKKSEIFYPPSADIAAKFNVTYDPLSHGYKGRVHNSYNEWWWPTTTQFIDTAKELGVPIQPDGANGNAFGAYFITHNLNPITDTRDSAREAYYDEVSDRPNLHLLPGNQVTQVILKQVDSDVRATGVQFQESKNGSSTAIHASKEVIMAAGAVFTPQILQASGIGDPAYLESINVTTIVNLPAVGQNFHDHIRLQISNTITAPLTQSNLTDPTFAAQALAEYRANHTGPYSAAPGNFVYFLPLSMYSNQSDAIYNQAVAESSNASSYLPADAPPEVIKGYNTLYPILADDLKAPDSAAIEVLWNDGAILVCLQRPFSRGSVKAASASVFDKPLVDSAYLRNPLDLAVLVEAVKFARKMAKTNAMSTLSPVETSPGPTIVTDDQIANWTRYNCATEFHPSGSCKLGPQAEGGVVDEELKVYGVNGLRIVDASIIPMLPASHTMTIVFAVAEKAADIIRGIIPSAS